MVPWEDQLSPVEIQQVSSFILSLKGSTPANPKDPQGELFVQEAIQAEELASDSTAIIALK